MFSQFYHNEFSKDTHMFIKNFLGYIDKISIKDKRFIDIWKVEQEKNLNHSIIQIYLCQFKIKSFRLPRNRNKVFKRMDQKLHNRHRGANSKMTFKEMFKDT